MIDAPGIYDLTEKQYNADPCAEISLRSSTAWQLVEGTKRPAHVRMDVPRLNPKWEPTNRKHFDIGKAVHKLVLGKGAAICDIPGYGYNKNEGTKKAPGISAGDKQELRDAAYDRGEIPLQAHEREQVEAMAKSALAQLEAYAEHNNFDRVPFSGTETERTIVWREGRVLCRAMLDGLPDSMEAIDEFKSDGETAEETKWRWKARRFGYFFRLAFYRRGLEALGLAYSPHFRFWIAETFEPYLLNYIPVDDELIAREDERVKMAIKIWDKCMTSNEWPGFPLVGTETGLTDKERQLEQVGGLGAYNAAGHMSSDDIAATL